MACARTLSVGQRVAGARRRLRPVGVDLETAVGQPADIAGVHEQLVVPRHLDSVGGAHVTGVGEQQFRRQHALGERATVSVQVGEHGVEHPRPLHQPGLEHVPIGGGDHQRQRIQVPGPGLDAGTTGDRLSARIDSGVGDVVVVDQLVHRRAQPTQPGPSALADGVGKLGPGRPHVSGFVDEFVVADHRALQAGRRRSNRASWARAARYPASSRSTSVRW